MELDERKMKILRAIIDDYILTGAPIGSRTISKRADFNLSSATIRNEMSDLEAIGLLEQPHTSAGRIPSDKAYRLYVDEIMRRVQLTPDETHKIQSYFSQSLDEIEQVVKQTARALSDITRYTAMVLPPQFNMVRLRHLQLVPLSEGRALVVIVTDTGYTRDSVIRIPEDMNVEKLERLSRILTKRFYNMRLDQISFDALADVGIQTGNAYPMFHVLLHALQRNIQSDRENIELCGTTNILHYPEYNDMNKVKEFLAALEGKDALYRMLTKATTVEFSITIGVENEQPELKDCSVVTATYKLNDQPLGSFGVIGPTRMNYTKVFSIFEYMQMVLGEVISNLIEEDKR